MRGQPSIYEMITGLGTAYDTGLARHDASRKRQVEENRISKLQSIAEQYPGQLPPASVLGAGLLSVGDVTGALAAGNLAQSQSNQEWTRKFQTAQLGQQERQLNKPQVVGSPETGYRVIRPQEEATGPAVRGAAGPNAGFVIPPKPKEITADDKKAVRTAETENLDLDNTISSLDRALKLNPQTFDGMGATLRAAVGSKMKDGVVPDFIADQKGADATTEWLTIMSPQAIAAMSASLAGATTNFELQKFEQTLADPSTPKHIREATIKRMKVLAERKREMNAARTKDIREGTYYKPQGAAEQAAPMTAPTTSQYVEGKRYKSKSIDKVFVIRNGQPVEE